jgi:hypothetical protein
MERVFYTILTIGLMISAVVWSSSFAERAIIVLLALIFRAVIEIEISLRKKT